MRTTFFLTLILTAFMQFGCNNAQSNEKTNSTTEEPLTEEPKTISILNEQSEITVLLLTEIANCSDLNCFDTYAKKLGYSFRDKKTEEEKTLYYYTKNIHKNGWEIDLLCSYGDAGKSKPPVISFATTSIAIPNFKTQIKEEAKKMGFTLIQGSEQTLEGSLGIFYETSKFKLELWENSAKDNGQTYDRYRIAVKRWK